MDSDYGLISVIKGPMITKLTQQALIEFETEYAKYVLKVTDANLKRSKDAQLGVPTIHDCMGGNVLHVLCIMGKIEGGNSVEQCGDLT